MAQHEIVMELLDIVNPKSDRGTIGASDFLPPNLLQSPFRVLSS